MSYIPIVAETPYGDEIRARWAGTRLALPPAEQRQRILEHQFSTEEEMMRTACILAFLGWPKEAIADAFTLYGPVGLGRSEKWDSEIAQGAHARVFTGYERGQGWNDDRSKWVKFDEPIWIDPSEPILKKHEADRYLRELRQLGQERYWPNLSGKTDRAVWMAMIEIGLEHSRIAPGCAQTELLERANVAAFVTVRRSRDRLTEANLCRGVEPARGRRAARFVLTWPMSGLEIDGYTCPLDEVQMGTTITVNGETIDQSHPAFQTRKLGRSSYQMLEALVGGALEGPAWKAASGVCPSGFYKCKSRLLEEGLVVESSHGSFRLPSPDIVQELLDLYAEDTGADVIDKNRQERRAAGKRRWGDIQLERVAKRVDVTRLAVIDSNTVINEYGKLLKIDEL